jgi:hypothetical protein
MFASILLRAAVLCATIFALALLLLHLHPNDDAQLRAFLDVDGGFMGIAQGVTTRNQALALLEAHPWVGAVSTTDPYVLWEWSGAQPAFIDASAPGQLIIDNRHLVGEIHLHTRITFSQLWLALGIPGSGYTTYQPDSVLHYVEYTQYGFSASAWIPCPAALRTFWATPVLVQSGANWRLSLVTADYPHLWRQRARC